ncbi:hypothetical protein CTI12_AA528730 [Artemisia annua]|uniref:DUF4371 domain-containing protein n=1 Tax=Artemisia annua TaxID=35608 RepID=A0A2U1L5V1_ARTAN|nr:hypothetical protein CTI12_AA528730 [Artemisia annua]
MVAQRLLGSVISARHCLENRLPFRGHDESESSRSKGCFLSNLKLVSEMNPEIVPGSAAACVMKKRQLKSKQCTYWNMEMVTKYGALWRRVVSQIHGMYGGFESSSVVGQISVKWSSIIHYVTNIDKFGTNLNNLKVRKIAVNNAGIYLPGGRKIAGIDSSSCFGSQLQGATSYSQQKFDELLREQAERQANRIAQARRATERAQSQFGHSIKFFWTNSEYATESKRIAAKMCRWFG